MDAENNSAARSSEASRLIEARRSIIVDTSVARQYELQPELKAHYTAEQHARFLEDTNYHLSFLEEAVTAESPTLFSDYVAWVQVLLANVGVPAEVLIVNLQLLRDVVADTLRGEPPEGVAEMPVRCIEAALGQIPGLTTTIPSFIMDEEPYSEMANLYLGTLLSGDRHRATKVITDAVPGVSVKDIYLHVFQPSQREIGRLWQTRQINVAQEHYCTAVTQQVMSLLYPFIFSGEKNGRVLVATCIGKELHEIGLRMVTDFFEMAGWDTFYLGASTPISSIVQTVAEKKADVLAISATMTFHIQAVRDLISAVRASLACDDTVVLVGGRPFNVEPTLWKDVRADAYAPDAFAAIDAVNQMLSIADRSPAATKPAARVPKSL